MNFAKILRIAFLQNTSGRLLLEIFLVLRFLYSDSFLHSRCSIFFLDVGNIFQLSWLQTETGINEFISSISNCIAVTKQCDKTVLYLMYLDNYFTSKQCNSNTFFRRSKMANKFALQKFIKQNGYSLSYFFIIKFY